DHYFARLLPATAFFLVWLLNYSCFKAKTYFTAFQYVLGRAHTSKDLLKLVGIGIGVASPIAWYVMNQWLQNFAYRIKIEWWMFGIVGGVAIVIALLTISLQSIRAALVNPVHSLRSE
ncbi:ABC transporter permease, partial [Xanthocytophaga flava]|uniref:ABC transporter permease n=1 Tax=Xanthocytophaga flava TaxID=3048013 RepID=UPI0028F67D2B|nr:ABC transporter permease [Xanthocytophaga flavus]